MTDRRARDSAGGPAPAVFPVDGVLFDCDGVLVDSLEAAAVAWDRWSTRWAPHFDFRTQVRHGVRAIDLVAELVPTADVERAAAELASEELATVAGTTAVPGAVELSRALSDHGVPWAVVTSGLRPLALGRLRAAGLAVPDVVITAEDVAAGKPDPEPYATGADRIGVAPSSCAVFEDAPAGVRSARAAGVTTVIGVGHAIAEAHAVAEADPAAVVLDLRSVTVERGRLVLTHPIG
ncbi:HAD-IA family hydrolase [Curtobacterium sp. NPDC090217]|uniref:HAD-IA family hydrolase n=1 Tax=Curtobacterium sp. NPDC090217 TaxID=3363970 RepID=UPI0038295D95